MQTKQTAIELVKKFYDHVNPYIGSGMLSNTIDDSAILWQSKKCALIAVDTIIKAKPTFPLKTFILMRYIDMLDEANTFWNQVKSDIETLTPDDVS
jgi:hypothetical protein